MPTAGACRDRRPPVRRSRGCAPRLPARQAHRRGFAARRCCANRRPTAQHGRNRRPLCATFRHGCARRRHPRTAPLVAYFTRCGNTRTIAALLNRDLDGDLFEIEPATPYPADYFATVDQATHERERNFLPPLKASVSNLSSYKTVFLGFPIWGASEPPIVRSLLANQDFTGKTIIPFNLHGGDGLGNSREIIARPRHRQVLPQGSSWRAFRSGGPPSRCATG